MQSKISRNFVLLCLIFTLGLAPTLSYAKNDGKGKDNKHDKKEKVEKSDKEDKKLEKACFKAFGHLFARGFIKNKGQVEFPGNCLLPFGISKKFGDKATSTPDTTSPVISNVSVKVDAHEAVLTWKTNERADGTVFWSLTSPVNTSASSTATSTESRNTKEHKVTISGLTASTTYYAVIRSKDASGNTTLASQISFTTKALAPDNTAPVISGVALLVGTSTINVGWKTNERATSRVYYSTSSSIDINSSSTPFVTNSTLTKDHLVLVTSLSLGTQYYLVAESRDESGNKTTTPTFSATTASTTYSSI